jgi:hypothetical protein
MVSTSLAVITASSSTSQKARSSALDRRRQGGQSGERDVGWIPVARSTFTVLVALVLSSPGP